MSGRFQDQVILISGAARGMGASHARAFAAEGGRVVIADTRIDEAQNLAAELGAAAMACLLDVRDFAQWESVVTLTAQKFGAVDVLVNNAGVLLYGAVTDETPEQFRHIIDINLTGVFLGMRAVIPGMRARGRGAVINISSAAGLTAYPGSIGYAAAKWGVRGMSRAAAVDCAHTGVRVNCVFPGPTSTPMVDQTVDASFVQHQAIPRWSAPQEVSKVVLFLASGDASYCTGGEYAVDGGASLGVVPAPR